VIASIASAHAGPTAQHVSVDSEAALEAIVAQAREAGVPCALIVDAGVTEFRGVPTKTCCAVGPAWADAIDAITGALPLL
jgi:PTH2 family peptidyl-tRNA hydrolase